MSEVFGESAPIRTAPQHISPAPAAAVSQLSDREVTGHGGVLARFIEPHTLPRDGFEAELLRTVQQLKAAAAVGDKLDAASLAAHLVSAGYAARVVVGGRSSNAALSLKHNFVAVDRDAEGRPVALIVEPQLQSHFQISRPSPLYSGLIDDLPDEFVGDADRLRLLCSFVGDQMSSSFHQNGMAMPPWRNVHSLLSKWNLGQDRSGSPENSRPAPAPPKPPTFRRSTGATAAAAAAAAAAQLPRDNANWVSRYTMSRGVVAAPHVEGGWGEGRLEQFAIPHIRADAHQTMLAVASRCAPVRCCLLTSKRAVVDGRPRRLHDSTPSLHHPSPRRNSVRSLAAASHERAGAPS